ncbi:Transcription factor E2F4 [Liparis tanakae]|uniref:Transcription factor E2F4 n=1 Tax=Liparis tanakae TaxID=230148 RepID=A0A4Z2HTF7_9TELE|nr:Transcription factor E2F4 [Liparis tanakae]
MMMELESASSRGELGAVGDSLQPQTPSRHEKSLGLLTTKFVTLLQEAKDGVLDLKATPWRGVGPGCNTREIADKLIDLKAELDDLALRENELDQQRVWVQQSIKNILNGQRKYQIRLKSSSGPIEVLLVNKDPSSASPVVLPVPPPDDILQNLPAPTPTSQPPPTAVAQVCRAAPAINTKPGAATTTAVAASVTEVQSPTQLTPTTDTPAAVTQQLQSSASLDGSASASASALFEPIKSDPSEMFSPLLRLSPPPSDHDYIYNLDETEGLCDLFDVPILNL